MIDSGSRGCPEQESAECHFGTLGRNFFYGKNKMAARYFKVKYHFLTKQAKNKCNTSFPCDFDWAINFLYYFYDLRSSSRSKSQFQGQISQKIHVLTNTDRNICNTSFAWYFVWTCIYGIIVLIPGNLQGWKSFPMSKTKWPPDISRSNIIVQQIKLGTIKYLIFYEILTG